MPRSFFDNVLPRSFFDNVVSWSFTVVLLWIFAKSVKTCFKEHLLPFCQDCSSAINSS